MTHIVAMTTACLIAECVWASPDPHHVEIGLVPPPALTAAGKRTLAVLLKAVDEEDFPAMSQAVEELARLEECEAAVPRITTIGRNEDYKGRLLAISALGQLGVRTDVVVPPLAVSLADKDPKIREASAAALGSIGRGAQPALPALITRMRDDEVKVRRKAAWAIGRLGRGSKSAIGPLTACIQQDRDIGVRAEAAASLWALDPQPHLVLPVFIDALRDNRYGYDAAIRGIVCMKGEARCAVPLLASAAESGDAGAIAALISMGKDANEAIPALLQLLGKDDQRNRLAVAKANAFCAIVNMRMDAVPALRQALARKEPSVRYHAAQLLGAIGPDAIEAAPNLRVIVKDSDERVRRQAEIALGRICP